MKTEQTEQIKLLDYNEAKELYENTDLDDAKDDSKAASVVIYNTVKEFGPTNALLLGNLTGLEFQGKKDLYEYFQKTLTLTKEDLARLAIAQISELLASKADTKEDFVNEISNLLS
jgi:hypothetical protein